MKKQFFVLLVAGIQFSYTPYIAPVLTGCMSKYSIGSFPQKNYRSIYGEMRPALSSWGFYAHRLINYQAVFLLPPEMMVFFKPNIDFIRDHATVPDNRRYLIPAEAPRHYIDIDRYGKFPYETLPRKWNDAAAKFGADSLQANGIVPWWIQTMLYRLTAAFKEKNKMQILRYASELGHYVADAHVPLHACSNHNGQFTNQAGIHAFWESRLPELLAETEWDLWIGQGQYLSEPLTYTWQFVLESAAAADTVLKTEAALSQKLPRLKKYAYETRNGLLVRQYSRSYSEAYDRSLNGMVERRLRQSIYDVASFWITAWVNAGQPDLHAIADGDNAAEEDTLTDTLQQNWLHPVTGRICD